MKCLIQSERAALKSTFFPLTVMGTRIKLESHGHIVKVDVKILADVTHTRM